MASFSDELKISLVAGVCEIFLIYASRAGYQLDVISLNAPVIVLIPLLLLTYFKERLFGKRTWLIYSALIILVTVFVIWANFIVFQPIP